MPEVASLRWALPSVTPLKPHQALLSEAGCRHFWQRLVREAEELSISWFCWWWAGCHCNASLKLGGNTNTKHTGPKQQTQVPAPQNAPTKSTKAPPQVISWGAVSGLSPTGSNNSIPLVDSLWPQAIAIPRLSPSCLSHHVQYAKENHLGACQGGATYCSWPVKESHGAYEVVAGLSGCFIPVMKSGPEGAVSKDTRIRGRSPPTTWHSPPGL